MKGSGRQRKDTDRQIKIGQEKAVICAEKFKGERNIGERTKKAEKKTKGKRKGWAQLSHPGRRTPGCPPPGRGPGPGAAPNPGSCRTNFDGQTGLAFKGHSQPTFSWICVECLVDSIPKFREIKFLFNFVILL